MKTHQIGVAIHVEDWKVFQDHPERIYGELHDRLDKLAHRTWLWRPTLVTPIVHPPGDGRDTLNVIGTVGLKANAVHRQPEILGHLIIWIGWRRRRSLLRWRDLF